MSKQASLFNFMARNEKDMANTMNAADVSVPVKTSKFKYTKPTSSRLQLQTNTNENRTLNIISTKTNGLNSIKKSDDCVVISDEDPSPVKKITKKKTDDDFFVEIKSNDFAFTRASTLVENEMDALYAKYGSPKPNIKSNFESLDIDKELNSNASYVNAMKKLDENLEQLKTSPKKTTTKSKFKFNAPSKTTSAIQKTTQIAASSNKTSFSGSDSGFSSMNSTSFKTATVTTGAYSGSISNSSSSLISNSIGNSVSDLTTTPINKFSPVNTSRNGTIPTETTTSQSGLCLSSSYRPESPVPISPTDTSFKSLDSP